MQESAKNVAEFTFRLARTLNLIGAIFPMTQDILLRFGQRLQNPRMITLTKLAHKGCP